MDCSKPLFLLKEYGLIELIDNNDETIHESSQDDSLNIVSSNLIYSNLTSTSNVVSTRKTRISEYKILEFQNLWNENCCGLPKASRLTDKRKKQISARLSENSDEEYWTQIVKKITASDFCIGKNDRNWRADFDWFIKPDTHIKVFEGKYDSFENGKPKTPRSRAGVVEA
jgi:hypothetical protein